MHKTQYLSMQSHVSMQHFVSLLSSFFLLTAKTSFPTIHHFKIHQTLSYVPSQT